LERTLAAWLRWGTRASLALAAAGLAWMAFRGPGIRVADLPALASCPWPCDDLPGARLVLAGAALLIAVSAGRLVVLALLWARQGDRRMAAMALAAMALVLAALAFRM
jgi:hypothetical protein